MQIKIKEDKNTKELLLLVEEDNIKKRIKLFDLSSIKVYLIYHMQDRLLHLYELFCDSFYKMNMILLSEYKCLEIKYNYYKIDLECIIQNEVILTDQKSLLLSICDVLNIFCENDIINGNLKSSNILCNEENLKIKIIDLFLNELRRKEDLRLYELNFMSPEEIRNKELDDSSMIWSMGCVFYEIFTNELPFTDKYKELFIKNNSYKTSQEYSKIPLYMLDMLNRIFDLNPNNRPKLNEIRRVIITDDKKVIEMKNMNIVFFKRFTHKISKTKKDDNLLISNEKGTILLEHDLHLKENSSLFFSLKSFLQCCNWKSINNIILFK